jgi:hypothetical protein
MAAARRLAFSQETFAPPAQVADREDLAGVGFRGTLSIEFVLRDPAVTSRIAVSVMGAFGRAGDILRAAEHVASAPQMDSADHEVGDILVRSRPSHDRGQVANRTFATKRGLAWGRLQFRARFGVRGRMIGPT